MKKGAYVLLVCIFLTAFGALTLCTNASDPLHSVYDYAITDASQIDDTIIVSAECRFCSACNPNEDDNPGCDPFEPGEPWIIGTGYHDCALPTRPDGRFASVRLISSMGLFDVTQKLICNDVNWPLDTLFAHNFVFTGLTIDSADTITVWADFYCSWCGHWYAEPLEIEPEEPEPGQAWIVYKTTDATIYDFGDVITVTIEVDTTLSSQFVIVDTALIDPADVSQDYESWTGTITPGPDPITQYLNIPASGIAGTWKVFVTVLNSEGEYQDSEVNLIWVGVSTIESYDLGGNPEDEFTIAEDVYVMGCGYAPSTTYNIYVVEDVATWTDGMPLPSRVSGTVPTVTSAPGGCITHTLVWDTPVVGKYDIVVDVLENGVYDEGIDALDDGDIEVTAGFFIIPELPFGTLLGLATCLAAFGLLKTRRLNIKF